MEQFVVQNKLPLVYYERFLSVLQFYTVSKFTFFKLQELYTLIKFDETFSVYYDRFRSTWNVKV